MQPTEISPEKWGTFLHQFSMDHIGWQSAIEIHRPDEIPERMGDGLPLISIDLAGGRPGDWQGASIAIHSGEEEHLTHTIGHVRQVLVSESPDTPDAAVHIEPDVGPVTVLRIWSAERRTA